MQKKARVETRFVDMATALGLFADTENLLELLREGSLVAHGRHGWFGGLAFDENLPAATEIPSVVWSDYTFVEGINQLTDGSDNYYCAIQISREALEKLVVKSPDGIQPNKGGAPYTHDWLKVLLPPIMKDAFEDEPTSLEGWAKRAINLDIWPKDKIADLSTVRRTLKPFYDLMFAP